MDWWKVSIDDYFGLFLDRNDTRIIQCWSNDRKILIQTKEKEKEKGNLLMSDDGKTEVEFAGVKFRGGKIFIIITALSTLGGGLYAGFEFWKDYMDMKEKIETYVAPDLSGFDKKLAVLHKEMTSLRQEMTMMEKLEENIQLMAESARDEAREIKRDLKREMDHIEKTTDDTERRVKEDSREFGNAIRSLEKETDTRLKNMEKELDLKIKKSLNNPLSAISK